MPATPNQPGSMNYTQAFGSSPNSVAFPHIDIRAPGVNDVRFAVGQRWIDTVAGNEYSLTSFSVSVGITTANWAFLGSSSGDLNSLTTDDLTVVTPTAGTILFHGTANQIVTTGANSPGSVTSALSPTLIAPGSITATTTLTATLGAITATNGNIVRGTAGNKDVYTSVASTITAGANSAGTVTLVAGEAVISTTAITAASQIRIYRQGVGATGAAALGVLSILTRTAGVSFTIRAVNPADATAAQASDVSVIAWEIVN